MIVYRDDDPYSFVLVSKSLYGQVKLTSFSWTNDDTGWYVDVGNIGHGKAYVSSQEYYEHLSQLQQMLKRWTGHNVRLTRSGCIQP